MSKCLKKHFTLYLGICHTEEDPNKGRKTFLVSCQYHALVPDQFDSVITANEFDIAQALGFPLCILMGYGEYMYDMYIHQISI